MANYKYIKPTDVTDEWLEANDFKYDKFVSDRDCPGFIHRFPVYKYEGSVLLDGQITIFPTIKDKEDQIRVNVYEHGTRNIFARFYYWEYGTDDEMMRIVNNYIYRELKKMGIKVIKPDGEEQIDDE